MRLLPVYYLPWWDKFHRRAQPAHFAAVNSAAFLFSLFSVQSLIKLIHWIVLMNVFILLIALFVALIVIIPLIEKSGVRFSDQQTAKIARWIWPLVMISMVVSLIYHLYP